MKGVKCWIVALALCGAGTAGASVEVRDREFPPAVERALSAAGGNRASLERMLLRYKRGKDRERYEAACYLVAGMPWHAQGGRVVSYDRRMDSLRHAADAAYYGLIRGTTAEAQESDPLHRTLVDSAAAAAARVGLLHFGEPEVVAADCPDVVSLDGDFVRAQVEHAFALRRGVERVRRLSFDDFCEYVLPYRSIGDYPIVTPAEELHSIFAKYLMADTARSVAYVAARYNRAMWWLRRWHGAYPYETTTGLPELFYMGFHDCVDIAHYCAQTLRACGVPAAVEYNVAYKLWSTRHFSVAVPDEAGVWRAFSPESELPVEAPGKFLPSLNILRLHFAPWRDNPAALASGEPLPYELADPCIEDVTARYMETVTLTLKAPAELPAGRRLAYLASFRSSSGLVPVTWGEIDGARRNVCFNHVVPDNVYFPVYCNDAGGLVPFGQPFLLRRDTAAEGHCVMEPLGATGDTATVDAVLLRKYPRKPRLLRQAEAAVGTVVLGSDDAAFRTADTLGVIRDVPDTRWTDLALDVRRPYRYYRVAAPSSDPHLHLAEIQFLARRSRGYGNVIAPAAPRGAAADSVWVRLMDEPLEKCCWKAEYDGRVETAPDVWPDVTLRLEEPQWVERLRFVVKHADNGVRPGDTYRLWEWTDAGWAPLWEKRAETDELPAGTLRVGGLYWLSDVSRGREELPFVVDGHSAQCFPHEIVVRQIER